MVRAWINFLACERKDGATLVSDFECGVKRNWARWVQPELDTRKLVAPQFNEKHIWFEVQWLQNTTLNRQWGVRPAGMASLGYITRL